MRLSASHWCCWNVLCTLLNAGGCPPDQGAVGVGVCLQPHQDDQRAARGLPGESPYVSLKGNTPCADTGRKSLLATPCRCKPPALLLPPLSPCQRAQRQFLSGLLTAVGLL